MRDNCYPISHVKVWKLSLEISSCNESTTLSSSSAQLLPCFLLYRLEVTDGIMLTKTVSQSFIKISLYILIYHVRMWGSGSYCFLLWKLSHKDIKKDILLYCAHHKVDPMYSLLRSCAFVRFHRKDRQGDTHLLSLIYNSKLL